MRNSEFKIGDHILVVGNRGIVKDICKCKEVKYGFNGKNCGVQTMTDENIADIIEKGYSVEYTGRTATYFTVSFDTEESLKNTAYDNGTYGCIDDFENFGTW